MIRDIISLPFSHPYLSEIVNYKEKKKKMKNNSFENKYKLLAMEKMHF